MRKLNWILLGAFLVSLIGNVTTQAIANINNPPTLASLGGCPLTGCTFTGAIASPTLALGGATIGTNALAVTGTAQFNSAVTLATALNTPAGSGIDATGKGFFTSFQTSGNASVGSLSIGGTNNTVPGIFHTGAVLNVRLADNSADAAFTAGAGTFSGQLNVTTMSQTSAAQSGTVCYNSGTGAITYDATLGCLTSSARFKTDIVDIDRKDALKITMALAPVSFRKRIEFGGDRDKTEQFGFIAEQIADVDERLIVREDDGQVRGVRYQQTTAILAGAIQELKREIDELRAHR